MTILASSSSSPKPQIMSETKDLPRLVPVSTSTLCKFRVSLCQVIKQPKTQEKTRRKNEKNIYKKKTKEEKGKKGLIRLKLGFPVKKMTCVISGAFSRKKPLAGESRGHRDDSEKETTEADESSLAVVKTKSKRNSLQMKSFWGGTGTRLKILILGKRLKTTRRRRRRQRRSLSLIEGNGEEELCKKRILMGERCKPINRSGVLQYDGDGILIPEP